MTANRDREKPHGSPLPHHRTYGSRIRRFGRLSRFAWATAYHYPSAVQPERHLTPRQRRFHPSHKTCVPGLAGCNTSVPWHATSPLFQSPRGEPFRPSVRGVTAHAYRELRLSTLQCLTSVACLAPTTPSADFSTAFSARFQTPSFDPPKHRGDLPG